MLSPAPLSEGPLLGLLAVLQGLTEFLPVSSSGHLVLAQQALGLEGPAIRVDVALHLGTLAAVLVGYRKDLAAMLRDALSGDLREVLLLAAATVPAGVIGLAFRDVLHGMFESVRAAALGLCGTAVILALGERARRRATAHALAAAAGAPADGARDARPTWRQAMLVGCAQAVAILPGVSRSGTTIACGIAVGLAPRAAARFSFLLAIPTILGAAVLELPDAVGDERGAGPLALLLAAALAGGVGYAALRLLLGLLGRGAFLWFALYCGLLGATVLALS